MIFFMATDKGKPADNQQVIYKASGIYLKSYKSVVAYRAHTGGGVVLGNDWDYSLTTKRYVKLFLAGTGYDVGLKQDVDKLPKLDLAWQMGQEREANHA